MTLYCDICGGIRVNGAHIVPDGDEWRMFNPVTDTSLDGKYACRSCAKERLHGEVKA